MEIKARPNVVVTVTQKLTREILFKTSFLDRCKIRCE